MGVPSFFLWLKRKYPKIMENCICSIEEKYDDFNEPNKNEIHYDNFYIDMNGLIHPCFHPLDRQAPETLAKMMEMLCRYLDYLIDIVRPRKLLYMAVDGVAPRAKMNQQRSRRFKAAHDRELKLKEMAKQNQQMIEKGEMPIHVDDGLDSNCITSGTEFMAKVSETLKRYVSERMEKDDYWKSIVVIISDAGVPGEGEHKIIDFIRRQKESPDYNPNLHHCMYGLDADLIMLSLATHERFFSIIREKVFFDKEPCYLCSSVNHTADSCPMRKNIAAMAPIRKPFQYLHCHILREYLKDTFALENHDFERMIDDFIFFCFLVGNDFLPHIPSLNIREGGIDTLIEVYRTHLYENPRAYLTQDGELCPGNAQRFLREVGKREALMLEKMRQKTMDFQRRRFDQRMKDIEKMIEEKKVAIQNEMLTSPDEKNVKRQRVLEELEERKNQARKEFQEICNSDEIRLGESGYQQRYYEKKFKLDYDADVEEVRKVSECFFEGMNWVLGYYYRGCQSWE